MIRQNIFEHKTNAKNDACLRSEVAFRLPFFLVNTDEQLHAKTSQDDSNPAKGSKKNGFSTGFDHSNEVGFETNSTHSHDDEEYGELCERWKEASADTERCEKSS